MNFNEESFKKALSECKIIRWQNIFKNVVKAYLKAEKKQCTITDVGSSLKILCKDLNLDPESVLLEYCNTENGFEVFYDEGIEETYLVKKGFIQL